MAITKCARTGVPFEFDRLVQSNGTSDVHPQILLSPAVAQRELERLANIPVTKPHTKAVLQQAEYRLRLCGYIYAAHNELFDESVPLRVGGFIQRSPPLEEYATPRDVRVITTDAAALLGLVALTNLPHKMRELFTGMWHTALNAALATMNGTGISMDADEAFSTDESMTRFLARHLGQESFVSPSELFDYLERIVTYTEYAQQQTELFNTLYTVYQLMHLPHDCEAAAALVPKVMEAQTFVLSHGVDSISEALRAGKAMEGGPPEWKIGQALSKILRKLREYEPDPDSVQAVPTQQAQTTQQAPKFKLNLNVTKGDRLET